MNQFWSAEQVKTVKDIFFCNFLAAESDPFKKVFVEKVLKTWSY